MRLLDEFLRRKAGVERLVEREMTDLSRPMETAFRQAGNPPVRQNGLADAPRSHEQDRPPDPGFLGEPGETRETAAPLHRRAVRAQDALLPPGVFAAHDADGSAKAASRTWRPSTRRPEQCQTGKAAFAQVRCLGAVRIEPYMADPRGNGFRGPAVPQIAVIGGGAAPAALLAEAEAVGRELAQAGANLVCGGLSGVMEAACRGAAAAGGLTIGILPGTDRADANPHVACAIPTGLGHFRNFLVVQAADGVIALAGGSGTRSEAAMAETLGKPVVTLLTGSQLPGALAARSAAEAVRLVITAAGR